MKLKSINLFRLRGLCYFIDFPNWIHDLSVYNTYTYVYMLYCDYYIHTKLFNVLICLLP